MIRPAALAVAFALASPATAGSLEDSLRLVPPDAVAAVVLPSLKTASDDLQLAVDAAGKAEAALGGRPIDLLKGTLGVGAGLDDRGAFVMWASSRGGAVHVAGAIPVVDADEFVKAAFTEDPGAGQGAMRMQGRPGTFRVRKAGKHVLVSEDQATIDEWEPRDGFAAALEGRVGRRGMELVRTADCFAWASAPALAQWSLAVRSAAEADAEVAGMLASGGLGGGGLEERIAAVARHRARAGEILDQVEDAIVTVDFDALAVGLRAWARFADGSELAKALPGPRAQPRDVAGLLDRLPGALPYGAAGIDLAAMGGLAHLRSVLATMPEGDRLRLPEWVDRVQAKVKEVQVAAYPSKLGVMVGGLLNDASFVVVTDDPPAVRESLKAWVAEQAGERGGVRTEVTWEDARQLKDGSTAAAFAVKEVRRDQGAIDLQAMLMRQFVLGTRGLHGFAREVPGALVVTFSQRADVLDRATKAASGGKSLGGNATVRAMAPWLVPDADAVVLVGIGELLGAARQVAETFPGADPGMVPPAPDGLEPVAFAVRSKDRTWEAALVIPARIIGVGFDAARGGARAGNGDGEAASADEPVPDRPRAPGDRPRAQP